MVTETELAQALDNILGYVVTAVICCGEEGCQQMNCWSCQGSEVAEAESKAAEAIFQASGKVLKEWKASKEAQKCGCDASEFYCCVIPPVCPEYIIGHDGYCAVCWHNKECHQPKPEQPK
jgi:hypothetical protein